MRGSVRFTMSMLAAFGVLGGLLGPALPEKPSADEPTTREVVMTRHRLSAALATAISAVLIGIGISAPTAAAAGETLRVCPSGCRYTEIAPAVAAAKSGDTIRLGAGTYAGGVIINVSIRLVGSGAQATLIRGGGPVLTIGTFDAASEPTVSIDGVTITGGVTRSSAQSVPNTGEEGVIAAGGGVEIPPMVGRTTGATVTISNSVISGNRVAPTHATTSGPRPPCPSGPCAFALAVGGGIDNWGTLTLAKTTVMNNLVGSASGLSNSASDAYAGGIMSRLGELTIRDSTISGNQASANAPTGRFADGGAIFIPSGALTLSRAFVIGNSATLNASWPASVDMLAIAGGLHIGDRAIGTLSNTVISGNSVAMTNTNGPTTAFSGGAHSDVDIAMTNVALTDNKVVSTTLPGSSGDAYGDSGAGEMGGTATNVAFVGNTVSVTSAAGKATAAAGATVFYGSITNGLIRGNQVHGSSPQGSVDVVGGGLQSAGPLTLRDTVVSANTGDAQGLSGSARGGGIFNAPVPDGPPDGPLTLVNSAVITNVLSGSSGISLQGGGVYARNSVTLTRSVIEHNVPDQCNGC